MKNHNYSSFIEPGKKYSAYWLGTTAFIIAQQLTYAFTRKNLGERRFSFDLSVFICIVLAIIPIALGPELHKYSILNSGDWRDLKKLNHFSYAAFILDNITWYIYLGLFIFNAYKRKLEIDRLPSVFELARHTRSKGEINERITNLKWMGRPFTNTEIEILVEPGLFLILGILLIFFHQLIGYVIVIFSLICALSSKIENVLATYKIMDIMDGIISGEETERIVIDLKQPKDTRGASFPGKLPKDRDVRKRVVNYMQDDDDIVTVS
ncbi:hypothetical protein [Emticicia fontis]